MTVSNEALLPPTSQLEAHVIETSAIAQSAPAETESTASESGGLRPSKILLMIQRKYKVIVLCMLLMVANNAQKAIKAKPVFRSSFQLLVEPIKKHQQLQQITDSKESSNEEFDYDSQIEVLLSPKVLAPLAEKLGSQLPGLDYGKVSGQLSVRRLGETKILEVGYSADNPLEVKKVLEAIADGYLSYSREDQRVQFRQGLEFIQQQLPKVQGESDTLQQELQNLRQRYGFLDPDDYAGELRKQISEAASQRQGLQASLIALQARYRSLEGIARSAVLDQSEAYQAYLQEYQVLERQIAVETARFGDKHPTIELFRRQQQNLLPLLQAEAKRSINNQLAAVASDISVLQAQINALDKIQLDLANILKKIPAISRRHGELLQKISIVNASLNRLLETKEVLEIAASQNEVPWQLIVPVKDAQSDLPTSLSKALIMGLVSGFIVGLVVTYLIEKFEDTFYTLDDLEEKTKLSILGAIPFRKNLKYVGPSIHQADFLQQKTLNMLAVEQGQSQNHETNSDHEVADSMLAALTLESGIPVINPEDIIGDMGVLWDAAQAYAFLEAFRTLHTNLTQLKTCKTLTISSALPAEGKSTVAVLLAQSAAAMGKKVLLVDAHLQQGGNPIHEFLGMTSTPGLSDYLLGIKTLDRCLRPVPWESDFWVLTAGSVTTDPSRFLASPRMSQLMKDVVEQFDWVIYDVPSIGALADARLIAHHTQGLLLVLQLGKRGSIARFAKLQKQLSYASIPLTGLIVNGVRGNGSKLYQRSQ